MPTLWLFHMLVRKAENVSENLHSTLQSSKKKTKTKNYNKRTPSSLYLSTNTCQIVFRINHTSLKSITSRFKYICEVLSVQKCM